MKLLKFGLNFWITITSVFSFLTGWILLAHAPKPIQNNSSPRVEVTPLPTLEPLSPLSDFNSGSNNSQPQSSPFFNFGFQSRRRSGFGSFSTGGS